MDRQLSLQYYSSKGYWKGLAVIKKLAEACGVLHLSDPFLTANLFWDWLSRLEWVTLSPGTTQQRVDLIGCLAEAREKDTQAGSFCLITTKEGRLSD